MAIAEVLRATATVTIRASAERAFDAWLDPNIAARFLAGGSTQTVSEFANEPVEGGAFRVTMRGETGAEFEHEGHYVAIDRPRRLVFTWISKGTLERLSLVTVTFTPVGEGVRLDLVHEGLPDDVRAGQHTAGWTTILNKLDALLGQ